MITEWTKRGVYGDLTREMQRAHGVIVRLYEREGEENFFVTGRRDTGSFRMHGTFHERGDAEDYRKPVIAVITKEMIQNELKKKIGPYYDVIEKPDHFHTEYDPK